jgi:TRAP-type C4-dicarboxylate transport system substrate-binding protein
MKRLLIAIGIISVMLILMMAACSGPSQPSEPAQPSQPSQPAPTVEVKELKMPGQSPESFYGNPAILQFIDDVEKYTNGEYKIKIYWAGTLAEIKDLPELTRTGAIDMSYSSPGYYAGLFPLTNSTQSFCMVNNSLEQASYIWNGLFHNFAPIQQEYEKQNQHLLQRAHLSTYRMICTKPLATVADLKGKNFRGLPGAYFGKVMESVGAMNSSIPIAELPEALARGAFDGLTTNYQYVESLSFYETCKYLCFPVGNMTGPYITINLDLWNGFTPEVKEAFTKAAEDWMINDLNLQFATEDASLQAIKAKGCQEVAFPKGAYEKMLNDVGDPWEACQSYLVNELKADPATAEAFVKMWKDLGQEYMDKYANAGKTKWW